jgi:SAM-dependent methyltransferase
MLSDTELLNLYENKVKLPVEYFNKYHIMPPCPVKKWNYSWDNHDFPRAICVLDFIEWIKKYNIQPENMGITCNTDPELEFVNARNISEYTYPEYDLHTFSQKVTHNQFDFFVFNQTLEHLYNPLLCVNNIYDIVKPGGYVFTSVPTINIPHSTPIHFGGFNPMGLAVLFKLAGFEILELGQWGNLNYIKQMFARHTWPSYYDIHNNGMVSNEETNVCQCWILARKPS